MLPSPFAFRESSAQQPPALPATASLRQQPPLRFNLFYPTPLLFFTACLCRVTTSCWSKCVPLPVRDGDLSMGELTCVDRCVHKYLETQALVRSELETARGKMPLDFP